MTTTEQPPYAAIRGMLRHGAVIPFLGAGASHGALRADLEPTSPPQYLPSGSELARTLAESAEPVFPSKDAHDLDDLAKVASWYVTTSNRQTLRMLVHDTLAGEYTPTGLHDLLARSEKPLLIFTTNYDTLIEEAFIREKVPYDLVVYPADRPDVANALLYWKHGAKQPEAVLASNLEVNLEERSVIYKMHGTLTSELRGDNFVITEEDYMVFLAQLASQAAVPPSFHQLFEGRNFLFLGYGLRDWNLRVILHQLLRDRLRAGEPLGEGLLGWAIQVDPTPLECGLWRTRGVRIYDVPLDRFVEQLAEGA
jgi:SIR2-like domain